MSGHFEQWAESDTAGNVVVNENFDAIDGAVLYGHRKDGDSGLVYGLMGGTFKDTTKANTTVTLTNNATNYIVALLTDGTISAATSTTNWDAHSTYARVAKVVTSGGVITTITDYRFDQYGLFGSTGSAGGSTQGRHSIPIMATAILPSGSVGCSDFTRTTTSSNHPDVHSVDFDGSTQEYGQFSVPMPKKWNEGTITAKFIWSHAATVTNFGVRWGLQAVAVSDDDSIDAAYGTAQEVTDTGGTTNDVYISAETSAITIAGSPAAEDLVCFRVYRDPANGADTMTIDARLMSVVLYITTDADTDA